MRRSRVGGKAKRTRRQWRRWRHAWHWHSRLMNWDPDFLEDSNIQDPGSFENFCRGISS